MPALDKERVPKRQKSLRTIAAYALRNVAHPIDSLRAVSAATLSQSGPTGMISVGVD
jgi:hypothetical protein